MGKNTITMIQLTCTQCQKTFERKPSDANKYTHHFCSSDCYKLWKAIPDKYCLQCNKHFIATDNRQKFCSQSCSGTHTNLTRTTGVRPLEGRCFICDTPIRSNRKYCPECRPHKIAIINKQDITISEVLTSKNKNARIRELARVLIKKMQLPMVCSCCGYSNYVEIHHIKPIPEFDINELLSVVNSPTNLMLVCPNCHWEVHHNLKEPIPIKK